jgi:hypothetical protein
MIVGSCVSVSGWWDLEMEKTNLLDYPLDYGVFYLCCKD